MKESVKIIGGRASVIMSSIIVASGCATNPDTLKAPSQIACVDLKETISFTGNYGPFKVAWTTKLEHGPYWTEKVDPKGTYYRAPQGGVSITDKNGSGTPGSPATSDGGFYVPNDPSKPVTIYRYFATAPVSANASQANTTCSTVGFAKDPVSSKISLVPFALGGAVGGASGGVVGKSLTPNSNMSTGQAAGVGAAGGLIAGVIIGSMINADIGKITPGQEIQDPQFMAKLRDLVKNKQIMTEIPLPTNADKSNPSEDINSK